MRISAKCDYACRALLALSMRWPADEPVRIQDLSEDQGIPPRYLVQILIQLRQLGLVKSIRGKNGGYILARPPKQIVLGKVIQGIGGPLVPVADTSGREDTVFADIWEEVEKAIADILGRITFEDICNRARGLKNVLIYQI